MSYQKKNKGFVILFAVLISSILLLIGMGMFRIAVKETILSSTARESTIAFFAADSAIECALFHDIQIGAFPVPVSTLPGGAITTIDCNDMPLAILGPSNDVYGFRMELDNGSCAFTEIDKTLLPNVVITARGYNVCNGEEPDVEDPLLLERVLQVRYGAGLAVPSGPRTPTGPLNTPTGGSVSPAGSSTINQNTGTSVNVGGGPTTTANPGGGSIAPTGGRVPGGASVNSGGAIPLLP